MRAVRANEVKEGTGRAAQHIPPPVAAGDQEGGNEVRRIVAKIEAQFAGVDPGPVAGVRHCHGRGGLWRLYPFSVFKAKVARLVRRKITLEVHEQPLHPREIGVPCGESDGLRRQARSILVDHAHRRAARQLTVGERDALRDRPPLPVHPSCLVRP